MKPFLMKNWPTMIVILMLLVGFGLLFYPDMASWWNARLQHGMVRDYYIEVQQMDPEVIADHFRRAEAHNADLSELSDMSPLMIGQVAQLPEDYMEILRIGGSGVMARIEVPSADINLPIFHSTTTDTLDRGAGHLEGTAFPVGGYSTHSVVTAHSALANARMFTDLERNVDIGHLFFVQVLDRRLAYRVDQIRIVLPHETETLRVEAGRDLMTLITCTPYAVNSHRLLVRGYRVPYTPEITVEAAAATMGTMQRVDMRIYIFAGFFVLFIIGFILYQLYIGSRGQRQPLAPEPQLSYQTSIQKPVTTMATKDVWDDYLPAGMQPNSSTDTITPTNVNNTTPTKGASPYAHGSPSMQYTPQISGYGNRSVAATAQGTKKKPAAGFFSSNKNIAACIAALLLVTIGSSVFFFTQTQAQPTDPHAAITGFEARIDDYRATHSEQLAALLIDQWLAGDEPSTYDEMDTVALHWLYTLVDDYNQRIYSSGQNGLIDPFALEQPTTTLEYFGFEEDMVGFMVIPALEVRQPIYMGASHENLGKGLAHLTGTSLPIGGASTNAVIVGHMYQNRNDIFGNVSTLMLGDEIFVTNFYQTLRYSIINVDLVNSYDTEFMRVQTGRDRLTLLIYRPDDAQRYLVVASRMYETE